MQDTVDRFINDSQRGNTTMAHRDRQQNGTGVTLRTCRCAVMVVSLLWTAPLPAAEPQFVDLSLLVGENYPCTWPAGFPLFQIRHYQKIGPQHAYNSDIVTIDGNTGTQIDVPPHSIPRPGTG